MRRVNDDDTIWRYMRLAPFMEMMANFAVFQTRVSEFDDALEGAHGYRNTTLSAPVLEFLGNPPTKESAIIRARFQACVTCWYQHNENESYAMWRVYGADTNAVAIATTVGGLRRALGAAGNVNIGGVEYTPLPSRVDSVHELFFHKRLEFLFEQEIRSIQVFPEAIPGAVQVQALTPFQMDTLLANIIVAPGMRDTMFATLLTLIQTLFDRVNRHFDNKRLRRSSLDSERLG